MDEKMRTMSFRLPEEMYGRLTREAINTDRTATGMLHVIIKHWFDSKKAIKQAENQDGR